jgi:MSHA biogenesis protein MshP
MKNTKVQGSRHKDQGVWIMGQGSKFFPCTLHLAPCAARLASPAFQHGFSLVSAIFLLVVIAALGTFAVTLSTTQQQSAALDVLGSRAYQASRAGIEWGAYQAITNPAALNCAALPATAANGPIAMTNTLQNFRVMVNCGSAAVLDPGTTASMLYQLTSTATQGAVATPDYVERSMSVTIAR